MGCSSGSRLAAELIEVARDTFSDREELATFYENMIELFQDKDCDTLDECVGVDPVFDEVWEALYPSDEYYDD